MIKLYFLTLIFILSGVVDGFGCKQHVRIPPYTDMITGGSPMLDYELQKGRSGVNQFIVSASGNLTYQGVQFTRPIVAARNATGFHIYRNEQGCLAVIIPTQKSQPLSPAYLVNLNTLSATPITLPGRSNVFWHPKGKFLMILTDYNGHYFSGIDMMTGKLLQGSRLRLGKNLLYVSNDPQWIKNTDIMTFTVKDGCNPYQVKNCDQNRAFKTYIMQVNAANLTASINHM